MNSQIEKALSYLDNAEVSSYFELMDSLIRNNPTYARLKREFISGKVDFDYYEHLRTYTFIVNRELFQDTGMRNIPAIGQKRKNVLVLYGYNSTETAYDVIKKLQKKIMTSDELRNKPYLIEIFKTIKDADVYLLFVDDSLLTSTDYLFDEIIDNIDEQVRKYNKKCVLLLIDKNIFSKPQPALFREENITQLKKMANNTNILQMNLEGDFEEKLSLIINTIQS